MTPGNSSSRSASRVRGRFRRFEHDPLGQQVTVGAALTPEDMHDLLRDQHRGSVLPVSPEPRPASTWPLRILALHLLEQIRAMKSAAHRDFNVMKDNH
jgi:hypothetical protein